MPACVLRGQWFVMNAAKNLQVLRNSQQFRQVYDQGLRFNTPFFSAFLLKTQTDQQRIGITVTRKIGNAVVRNRCKRRLREVLKKQNELLAKLPGFDLVLNAKSNLVEASFSAIIAEMANLIKRFETALTETES